MSWLHPRKKNGKIICYEYRWLERGILKGLSTKTKNASEAQKIKKKWDAAALLNGSEVLTETRKITDLSIAGQLELWLKEKKVDVKPGAYRRYGFHARNLQEFFRVRHVKFFS